jgi:DNA-binding MarR family transcriptional regulator
MSEFSLKSPHVSCLYYLNKRGPLTAKELRDICCEDKSYISHSLRDLETRGYVLCDSTAKKRYNAAFSLTEAGREIAARIAQRVDNVLAPVGNGLTEQERTVLYRSLRQICDNMEKICDRYETPAESADA